jgi:TatD DNase family protein
MIIDTHGHLTSEYCALDQVGDVIARAKMAGVGKIIMPGAEPGDAAQQIALCEKYDNLYCTLGWHPDALNRDSWFVNRDSNFDYEQHILHPRVVGIGEIGLDYHYENRPSNEAQIELFERQLKIAEAAALPVAIHTRDADEDTFNILKNYEGAGVLHCYTGGWDLAKKMLDRGFFISAIGIITFKNADDLREVFKKIPLDRLIVETDSPYCAPVPHRGKNCEPEFVADTARFLADLRGIIFEEFENILRNNTETLFPKIK